MNLCFIYYVLFIPFVNSINNTITNLKYDRNETLTTHDIAKNSLNKKTTTIISEGGSQVADNQSKVFPKENSLIDLKSVNEELGIMKQKSIQPRKGVGNPSDGLSNLHNVNVSSGITEKPLSEKSSKGLNDSETSMKFTQTAVQGNVHNTENTVDPHVDKTRKKKPVLSSYDALANSDKKLNNKETMSSVKSSLNTVFNDQMPPPNRNVKSYKMATKHPGMVTPVVITILVVPVFALLGYMAFKRGKEAWRNRHYKRMDFLLDGMYNE